jgi:hypothetical protein
VSKYDWVLLAGIVALAATALWYQVRYYKLVDDLIDALTSTEED